MRRSARSINVCERTDGLWGLPPELMCRVQRGKTWYSGSVGVYCRRTRVKMEILAQMEQAARQELAAQKREDLDDQNQRRALEAFGRAEPSPPGQVLSVVG